MALHFFFLYTQSMKTSVQMTGRKKKCLEMPVVIQMPVLLALEKKEE